MNRDWDKLRRQQKAFKPLSKAQWLASLPPGRRKHRSRFSKRHLRPFVPRQPKRPKVYTPIDRILKLWKGDQEPILSTWHRSSNGRWSCTKADPQIEWFLRIRHPQAVLSWISKSHLHFQWLKESPSTTPASAVAVQMEAQDNPAERSNARAPQGDTQTVACLNNDTHAGTGMTIAPPESCLEQTGLTMPCCLMHEP